MICMAYCKAIGCEISQDKPEALHDKSTVYTNAEIAAKNAVASSATAKIQTQKQDPIATATKTSSNKAVKKTFCLIVAAISLMVIVFSSDWDQEPLKLLKEHRRIL